MRPMEQARSIICLPVPSLAGEAPPARDGIETFDPKTLEYRARGGDKEIRNATKEIAKIEDPRERVRKLVAAPGKTGAFAWKVLSRSLSYAARPNDTTGK